MFEKLLAILTPWRVRPTESAKLAQSSPERVISAAPATASLGPVDTLPAVSHPAWRRLIDQQVTLETKDFALQMMLSWAWSQLQANPSEANKVQKINALHLYFKKNQHVLQKELKQLFS